MSSETNIKNHRSWDHVGNRLPRNPFDPIPIVEHLEHCKTCKMDVDVQIEAANAGGVDVYRKRCKRCGCVIQWGIGQRMITSKNSTPAPQKAIRFIQETGKNRT